jgi:hypothetical protein
MLDGPDVGVDGIYKREEMSPVEASATEVEMAREVIRTARGLLTGPQDGDDVSEPFLYARVDVVSGDDGLPVLLELEMVEPSLFTSMADGALERLADAVMARTA